MTNAEMWEDRLKRWSKSGLTAGQFAAREGFTEGRLFYWRKKLAQLAQGDDAPRLVAVRVRQNEPTAGRCSPMLEVVIDGQLTVRVPAEFEERALARVVRALGGGG